MVQSQLTSTSDVKPNAERGMGREVDKQQLPLARRKWFKLRPELKNFWNFKMGRWTNGNKMDTNFWKNVWKGSKLCRIKEDEFFTLQY